MKYFVRSFVVLVLVMSAMFGSALNALAWSHCGTPQAEADCAAHGLPGAPTPVPTPVPPPPPAPVVQTAAQSATGGGPVPGSLLCHPDSTAPMVARRKKPEAGDFAPFANGLCYQDTPAPTVVAAAATPMSQTPVTAQQPVLQPLALIGTLGDIVTSTPAPRCIDTSDLQPLLDENGEQTQVEDLPAWLNGEDVVLGQACYQAPEVPVIPPYSGDGTAADELVP